MDVMNIDHRSRSEVWSITSTCIKNIRTILIFLKRSSICWRTVTLLIVCFDRVDKSSWSSMVWSCGQVILIVWISAINFFPFSIFDINVGEVNIIHRLVWALNYVLGLSLLLVYLKNNIPLLEVLGTYRGRLGLATSSSSIHRVLFLWGFPTFSTKIRYK
jgi:hypothetical protein